MLTRIYSSAGSAIHNLKNTARAYNTWQLHLV